MEISSVGNHIFKHHITYSRIFEMQTGQTNTHKRTAAELLYRGGRIYRRPGGFAKKNK